MRIFSLLLVFTLLCSVSFAQQQTPATTGKAPATTATTANPTALGPANAKFQQLFQQFKTQAEQFSDFQTKAQKEFVKATPERQKALQAEGQKYYTNMQNSWTALQAAAKQAFKEAPNKSSEVTDVLKANLVKLVNFDDYEKALTEAYELIKAGSTDREIIELAAYAAFNSNNFTYAEQFIAMAKKNGRQINQAVTAIEKDLPYYKAAWAKEKALRDASTTNQDTPLVKLTTDAGEMTIELFSNEAPNTVANFLELVNKGFYNGLTFHRVLQAFMAQGGDPKGDGSGGPGYCIPCEVGNPNARIHFRGTLSMAHAGKDTGGSQFFITFLPTKHLDGVHTVFGRVVSGLDVLAKIQRNPDASIGIPPTKIIKAEVIRQSKKPLPAVKKLPAR